MRAGTSAIILDKINSVGGLSSLIANYPDVDRSMSGDVLLAQIQTQAVQYGTQYERAQVFMLGL